MSRNGAGTYNLPAGNPVVTGTTISSTWANNTLSDMASALTQSVAKDGQTVMTNNLPMGGFKLTNLAAGTNAGDSLRYQQLYSQGLPLDIASASTTDIGGQNTAFLNVTGTIGITSFGTNYNGPRVLTFAASLTLTHDATTLVLPNGQNIITKAGDVAIVVPKSTITGTPDGWKVASYLRYNNTPLVNDMQTIASASTLDFTATQAQLYAISGTTNVTAVTMYEAQPVFAIATGAFKLVNSSGLVVAGGADYTCTVNDVLTFIKDGSGNVYVFGIPIRVVTAASDPTFVDNSTSPVSSNWVNGKALITPSTVQTTSGAAFYDFTIPANVKRIAMMFTAVSTNGSSEVMIQLSAGGTVETTGYLTASSVLSNSVSTINSTQGFVNYTNAQGPSCTRQGTVVLNQLASATNTWTLQGSLADTSSARLYLLAGSKALAGAIDKVRITTVGGTELFDGGSINVSWEY